jgi:hypothetical protein
MFVSLTDHNKKLTPESTQLSVALRNITVLKALLPVAIAAVAIRIYFAQVVVPDGLCDDCYTTLRYAANLAGGNGFVFNIGEPVWGTTTPLFTLILAATASLFGVSALETATVVYGIAGYTIFWFLLLKILEEARVPRLISVPVVVLTMFAPAFFENSLSGMETPLVLALMAGSYLCYMHDRPVGLGLLFGLLLLSRIDTLAWIGVVGLAYIVRHIKGQRRPIILALAAFALTALPWHVFAWIKFHSLIPQTVTAKAVTNNIVHLSYWAYVVEFCRAYFPAGGLLTATLPAPILVMVVFSLFAILVIGGIVIGARYPVLRPLVAFWFAFNACFIAAKVQLFSWYLPPTEWLAYVLLLAGLYAIWNGWLVLGGRIALQAAPWCVLFVLLAGHCIRGDYRLYQDRAKHNPWTDLAAYIRDHTSPDDRIFLEHIGLVGYRSNRTLLDNIGLVSPEFVEIRRRNPKGWVPESLRKFQPEVAILYGWQLPDSGEDLWTSADRVWFASCYELAATVKIDTRMTNYVYRRKMNTHAGAGPIFQPVEPSLFVPVVRVGPDTSSDRLENRACDPVNPSLACTLRQS